MVTGAASGVGWSIGRRLADDGFAVVLVDINPDVQDREAELVERGATVSSVVADLIDRESIPSVAAGILRRHGQCDVLVNNAGTHFKTPEGQRFRFDEVGLREWDLSIALHMTAPMLLCQAFLPGMKERGWGRVVNIASRAARTYIQQSSAFYTASKSGLIGLTRAVAGEFAAYGVTCNSVAPGRIRTPLTDISSAEVKRFSLNELPVGRVGEPDEVAAAVSFLASDQAGFITGAVIDVNGGGFMAP
ncbi:SDR family NAD(P)-dependent oxidoreductase [Variovorax guangxiensis]|uniref:SDR family NAD(P)-dependent oxidoreductase n=1 Tax=Variovorax guangxiensis TaxID=1775474 RepID=UPI002861728E|nr:SDR family NAD(P)-dependent oxidoreductase [Variovorax guangxiensis]MDR6860476.1 NAD(P)-dependent dehydrogenase (short-subunit alcohol dehydrogenase family) [Variovorax guangxiensis]